MVSDLMSSSVRVVLLPRAPSRTFRSVFNLRSSNIRLCIDCTEHTHTIRHDNTYVESGYNLTRNPRQLSLAIPSCLGAVITFVAD